MDVTRYPPPGRPPCVAEIHIPGLLYLRIERLPRWLALLIAAAFPVVGTWLLTR